MKRYEHLNLDYPSGCIIAKVSITDCVYVDNNMRKLLKDKNSLVYYGIINDENWNGYGFKLEDVEKIKPIPVNGKLSFWDYDYPQKQWKNKKEE